jgi:NitT/TauT family transport system substrate-binding protein
MRGLMRLALAGLLAVAASGMARTEEPLKAKIGVLRLQSSAPVFIAQDKGYFRDAGLDVELKFFDAALLPVSTARKLMDDGGAKFLGWVGDETPWQLGAVFASPKTLSNKPLVTKLLAVLEKADREYHDVILASVKDGKADINEKTRPLLEIIAKYTNLPVEQVVGNCAYIDPDGKLDVKNVDNQIRWLQEQGFVDKGFDADEIIAKDFVKPD